MVGVGGGTRHRFISPSFELRAGRSELAVARGSGSCSCGAAATSPRSRSLRMRAGWAGGGAHAEHAEARGLQPRVDMGDEGGALGHLVEVVAVGVVVMAVG
jgi:hypothetical protein